MTTPITAANSARPGSTNPVIAQLFDPARLPDRDDQGYVSHPDYALVVATDDECDVTPFFAAAGLLTYVVSEDPTGDEGADGTIKWFKPETPEGWRLVAIYETDEGDAVALFARPVTIPKLVDPAPPRSALDSLQDDCDALFAGIHDFWLLPSRSGDAHAFFVQQLDRNDQPLPGQVHCRRVNAAQTHSDDVAVDLFAAAMKSKMAASRAKGRGGWESADAIELSRMLREHADKGDPVDVANFAMMLHLTGNGIAPAKAHETSQ